MLRIGLTGGIATGKSTVAEMIRKEFGVPVVDADAASREIVAPGMPALQEISERFGPEILRPDGQLDRKALGQIIMRDSEARKDLESITHPRILAHIVDQLFAHERTGAEATVVEAALMVETGSHRAYDKVLVVSSSTEIQLARLMERNAFSEEEASRWIDNQLPLSEKEAIADAVIRNDGDIDGLRHAVREAWMELGLPSAQ
jgi:dephospho-CoA kinase